MKLIGLFLLVSILVLSAFTKVIVAQDSSAATRPRRVKELPEQITAARTESELASRLDSTNGDSGTKVQASWVQLEKPNEPPATLAVERFARPKKSPPNGKRPSLFVAAQPTSLESPQNGKVTIISPKKGDKFAVRRLTVLIGLATGVTAIELLIANEGGSIVYDSGVLDIEDASKPWSKVLDLDKGEYAINVRCTGANGTLLEASVDGVKMENVLYNDDRSSFEASGYVGYGIDSFAASELRTYLNPEASGEIQERIVGGFDFAYRMLGDPAGKGYQVWVYGETVHGVRSADLDCTAKPDQPLCQDLLGPQPDPGQQLSAIIRKATSLEAFAGVRLEFAPLNPGGGNPARPYLKTQFGFVTVAGLGGDVVDLHQYIGAGLIATKGKYRNSYVELGFGKSDFFLDHRNKRWKIDGFLSWGSASPEGLASMFRPFAQITVDSDFGKGADSIQTYIGIDFDVAALWRKAQ